MIQAADGGALHDGGALYECEKNGILSHVVDVIGVLPAPHLCT